jgi:hypothetical protein
MESALTERGVWASGLAARLRLVQASFADEPVETRRQFLGEELDRALQQVSPSQRATYLAALVERFPAWQAVGGTTEPVERPVTAVPETPQDLLARLLELAPSLPPESKAEFSRRLQAAGFAVQAPAQPFTAVPAELLKRLGLPPDQTIQPERALKMLAGLTELVLALDQLVWTLWKQLAPRSNYRKESEFAKLAGPYVAGDPEVSTQLVAQPLEKTRRLIAALLGAVGRAGSAYARKHASFFAPDTIQGWAQMEKKWSESLENVCWRKYCEQYKEHAADPILEDEIQAAVAKAAENLILGRGAG